MRKLCGQLCILERSLGYKVGIQCCKVEDENKGGMVGGAVSSGERMDRQKSGKENCGS